MICAVEHTASAQHSKMSAHCTTTPTTPKLQIEYHRFEPYLRQAVRATVLTLHPQLAADDAADANAAAGEDSAAARREYFVSFYHLPQIMRVRDLKTGRIGRLVSVSGTVTRSSDVRPELLRGTFSCRKCGLVAVDVEQQFIYTEPQRCAIEPCLLLYCNAVMLADSHPTHLRL
jgi:DNA replication licensing factor MCM6